MHINQLYKIHTTDLKPAYYFKFDKPSGEITMKVLEFNREYGHISKLNVFPYTYFGDQNKNNIAHAFVTKRKYNLFMKKLKSILPAT